MTKEQQPFWGVGRLRLSVIGFAEPRLGKLQRSTPFCIHAKFGSVHYDLTRVELLKTYHINQGEKMKSRIIVLVALTSVLLLAGCKSEAEQKLDEICSKDMNDKDNRDACDLALMINCGGVVGVAAVQKCAKNNERSECAAIPSYCINNYTKAFGSEKK